MPFLDLKAQFANIRHETLEAGNARAGESALYFGARSRSIREGNQCADRVQSCHRLRFRIGCIDFGIAGAGNWARRRSDYDTVYVCGVGRLDCASGGETHFCGYRPGDVQPPAGGD